MARRSDNTEELRNMTIGKKNFRRNLQDTQRIKEYDRILAGNHSGRFLTREEWEDLVEEEG